MTQKEQDRIDGVSPFDREKLTKAYAKHYGREQLPNTDDHFAYAERFIQVFKIKPAAMLFRAAEQYKENTLKAGKLGWNASESMKIAETLMLYPSDIHDQLLEMVANKPEPIKDRIKALNKRK